MLFWLCLFLADFHKRFLHVSFLLTLTPFPEGFFWKADEVTLLLHHEAWDVFKRASAAHVVPNFGYMQFCYSLWRQFWQDVNFKYLLTLGIMSLVALMFYFEICPLLEVAVACIKPISGRIAVFSDCVCVCCCQHKHLNTAFKLSNTVGLVSVLSCKFCQHKCVHEQH